MSLFSIIGDLPMMAARGLGGFNSTGSLAGTVAVVSGDSNSTEETRS